MLIAIDIDSTIYPLVTEWVRIYNEKTGHGLKEEDIDDWYVFKTMTMLPEDEVYKILDEVEYNGQPYKDSVRTIGRLIEEGNQVCFHSAVFNSIQSCKKLNWLNRHFGKWEWDAIFGQGHERKLRYLNHHADMVIEDSINSIRFVTIHNPKARIFLYDQNWNQDTTDCKMDNVTRVNSWMEIREHLGMC